MSYNMAGHESSSVNLGLELRGIFKTPIAEVDPSYALIDSNHSQEPTLECFVPSRNQRLIAVSSESNVANRYSKLLEARLPVFSSFFSDKIMLLMVPEGARSLTSMLTSVARHPRSAEPVFAQAGRLFSEMYESGVGLPKLPALDQLAFVADPDTKTGAMIYVIPPYLTSPDLSRNDFLDQLSMELDLAGNLGNLAIDRLVDVVRQGWDGNS